MWRWDKQHLKRTAGFCRSAEPAVWFCVIGIDLTFVRANTLFDKAGKMCYTKGIPKPFSPDGNSKSQERDANEALSAEHPQGCPLCAGRPAGFSRYDKTEHQREPLSACTGSAGSSGTEPGRTDAALSRPHGTPAERCYCQGLRRRGIPGVHRRRIRRCVGDDLPDLFQQRSAHSVPGHHLCVLSGMVRSVPHPV